jgi:hypothetical protein
VLGNANIDDRRNQNPTQHNRMNKHRQHICVGNNPQVKKNLQSSGSQTFESAKHRYVKFLIGQENGTVEKDNEMTMDYHQR